jgi:hypothetical protein
MKFPGAKLQRISWTDLIAMYLQESEKSCEFFKIIDRKVC